MRGWLCLYLKLGGWWFIPLLYLNCTNDFIAPCICMMPFTANYFKNQVLLFKKRGNEWGQAEMKDVHPESLQNENICKEKGQEGHLCLALFVARNRKLLSFTPERSGDCFEPTCETDWNFLKLRQVFTLPTGICVSLSVCSVPYWLHNKPPQNSLL